MNYPNRLQRCTHEHDESQLKLNLRDHAFSTYKWALSKEMKLADQKSLRGEISYH